MSKKSTDFQKKTIEISNMDLEVEDEDIELISEEESEQDNSNSIEIMEKLNQCLFKYYKLRQRYRQSEKVFHESLKKTNPNHKPECVNCGRKVGTIFSKTFIKEGEHANMFQYIAKCMDPIKPCTLNIEFYVLPCDSYKNVFDNYLREINDYKKSIIESKNNLLFNYGKDAAMEKIEKDMELLKNVSQKYNRFLEEYIDTCDNPKDKIKLKQMKTSFGMIISSYKDLCKEYTKTKDENLIKNIVEIYLNEIKPLATKIREKTYQMNAVEVIAKKYTLIQKEHSILQLETGHNYSRSLKYYIVSENYGSEPKLTKLQVNIPTSVGKAVTKNLNIQIEDTKKATTQVTKSTKPLQAPSVISSYEDAYKIAKPYIDVPQKMQLSKPDVSASYYKLPEEVTANVWQMSDIALQNTLKYIMNYLNHTCYMLCVKNKTSILYKLEHKATAQIYIPVMKNAAKTVWNNNTITNEQKQYIQNKLESNEPMRFMQCVMKEFAKKETSATEYSQFINGLELPDGVYIMNLTDAIILRKDGTHPFPMVVGKGVSIGEYKDKPFIPIFSISGQRGYYDIPIPNYDDVMYVLGLSNINIVDFNTNWINKKLKAVFRGGPTGCGYTTTTNQRLHLATLVSEFLDIGITGKDGTINTKSIRFDPVYGIGMLNSDIAPTQEFLPMTGQSLYKYIIHVDGNVNAYRLLVTMSTGSLILRVESEYTSWMDSFLKPNVHYVPIKSDLSDLDTKIRECNANEPTCKQIALNGMNVARHILDYDNLRNIFQYIVENVSCVIPKIEYK